jgi:hypothetical protein
MTQLFIQQFGSEEITVQKEVCVDESLVLSKNKNMLSSKYIKTNVSDKFENDNCSLAVQ